MGSRASSVSASVGRSRGTIGHRSRIEARNFRRSREGFGKRVLEGKLVEVVGEVLLDPPTKRVGGREGLTGRRERDQTVGVDRLHQHRHPSRRRGDHPRQKEGRVVIGDDHRRVGCETLEQAAAGAGFGLDVGQVRHAAGQKSGRVVSHPVEQEAVQPLAGPGIADPNRFEDQQRPARAPSPNRPPAGVRN